MLHDDWDAALTRLAGRRLFAFSSHAVHSYADVRFAADDVFVFGPETRGLPDGVVERIAPAQRLRLPMVAGSRSLNLANSVAGRRLRSLAAARVRRRHAARKPGMMIWPARARLSRPTTPKEDIMAKKNRGDGVYRVIDVIGTSKDSWEDAAKSAVGTASKSLRDLRIAEVTKMDMKCEGGKVVAYRVRVQLSFKYED